MLSDDLKSLADNLGQYRETGATLTPQGVIAICVILRRATEDARKLEAAAAEPCVDTSALPGNVTSILDRLGKPHGTRDWVPVYVTRPYTPTDQGPGGAA